jgi:flagellar hook-associated protein 3 FlgL
MANISTLGQALDQIARLKTQQGTLDLLSTQLTTQKKTQVFSGLQNDVIRSQRARADTRALEGYVDNIKNADRRIKQMLNSLQSMKSQAENIATSLTVAIQEGDWPDLETIQDLTNNTLNFIMDLVNEKDGNRYLFAGADSSTKPLNDTGLFESFLGDFVPDETDLTNPPLVASGVIGQWGDGTITTDEFIAAYHSVNETVMGYSSSLVSDTAGKVFVRVDDNAEFEYTVLADVDPIKDILRALNVLKSLPPVEYAPGALNDPTATTLPADLPPFPPEEKQENFFQVINDLANMINTAIDQLDQQGFKLAQVQAQISKIKDSHTSEMNMLANIIGEVEDVDITETAAKINQLQTQLEASYSVTALLSQLTLANYI